MRIGHAFIYPAPLAHRPIGYENAELLLAAKVTIWTEAPFPRKRGTGGETENEQTSPPVVCLVTHNFYNKLDVCQSYATNTRNTIGALSLPFACLLNREYQTSPLY